MYIQYNTHSLLLRGGPPRRLIWLGLVFKAQQSLGARRERSTPAPPGATIYIFGGTRDSTSSFFSSSFFTLFLSLFGARVCLRKGKVWGLFFFFLFSFLFISMDGKKEGVRKKKIKKKSRAQKCQLFIMGGEGGLGFLSLSFSLWRSRIL